MKKLNYLLMVFAVMFTVGFSSCATEEEVTPKEEQLTSEQITELLNGNVYDGEVFYDTETELREITITFVEEGEFTLNISGGGVTSVHARAWEVKSDGTLYIKNVNTTSSNQNYIKITGIDANGFTFILSYFNDGEPVRVTKR